MNRPLIIFDTETATLRGAPHLLELGAIRVENGEVQDTFDCLVCPSVPIEPEASDIHGIDEDDVRDAPTAREVIQRFCAFVRDDWMAAHNAGFDTHVLGYEYARAGLTMPEGPVLDTLALAKRWIPEASDHRLDTLVDFLDLEESTLHRALPDAVYAWQVLEECLARAGGTSEMLDGKLDACTIPARAPSPARLSPRLRPLVLAATEGREVTLVYGEGEQPAPLSVLPRFLFRHDKKSYLEAECSRTGLLKTYRLDRVRKVL